jgi:hypothetical protein
MLNPKPDIDRQEAELEHVLEGLQMGAAEPELTPEKRRARRAEADADPLAFARIYFPQVFTAPFSDLHRHIAGLETGNHSVSGFPQSGKSAFAFLGRLVRHIALGEGGVACVAARTDDKANAHTRMLTRIATKNERLRYDYDLEIIQDRVGDYIFKAEAGQTRLVAASVNKGVRGTVSDDFERITLAVGDDLYDRETARSDLDNERVFNWITGELHRQMEDDGLCIVLGNAIVEGCPILRLKEAFADRHFSFPIMDAEGNPTWPAVYDQAEIAAKKAETPFDVWEGEYMERPARLGDVFKEEWLRTAHLALTEIVASITAIDPAHGESPHACFKAAFSLGITGSSEPVALDVWLRREPYAHLFDHLAGVHRTLPNHKAFLFENDFAQWNFARPYYQQWTADRGVTLPIIMHLASELKDNGRAADKESRILNLVHPHDTGDFKYHTRMTSGPDWQRYREQVLAFGEKSDDLDGLDAAATAYIMIQRYVNRGTFKPTAKRQMSRPSWSGGFH